MSHTTIRTEIAQSIKDIQSLGVYTYLLSIQVPPELKNLKEHLQAHFFMGVEKTNRIVGYLEDKGLLKIDRIRNEKGHILKFMVEIVR